MWFYSTTPKAKDTIESLWRLEKIILDTLDFREVVQKIVDSVLTELGYLKLGYRIVVLALVDEKEGTLKRISISQTEGARKALAITPVPFHEIIVPLSARKNYCIKSLTEMRPFVTTYWPDILVPPYESEADAIAVQKAVGIKTSMVYPVISKGKAIGILIFSMVKSEEKVSEVEKDLIRGFTDVVGLAVQNAKLYTSLEEAKEQLEAANEKLKELDKLKDEFVSVASHELRTPMTAIKSYLWMALAGRGGELTDKQKYYLDRAFVSADRLIRLVNNMLNVSRIESGRIELELEKLDIGKLARDVVDEVTPRATELGIKVSCHPPKDLPEVLADPDKIKEVLINLVGNSLKFTPKGGSIDINFNLKDGMVETSVKDTGKGIEKEDKPQIFKKFGLIEGSYETTQTDQGTGLGLYICKNIVELHQGEIEAESEGLAKGATFTFTLPIFKEEDYEKIKKDGQRKEAVGLISAGV
jgi:signal transduction histidine kinase